MLSTASCPYTYTISRECVTTRGPSQRRFQLATRSPSTLTTKDGVLQRRVLVGEQVSVRRHARCGRGLDPRAARRLERDVGDDRRAALVLEPDAERVVARAEGRAECGVALGVEREDLGERGGEGSGDGAELELEGEDCGGEEGDGRELRG